MSIPPPAPTGSSGQYFMALPPDATPQERYHAALADAVSMHNVEHPWGAATHASFGFRTSTGELEAICRWLGLVVAEVEMPDNVIDFPSRRRR